MYVIFLINILLIWLFWSYHLLTAGRPFVKATQTHPQLLTLSKLHLVMFNQILIDLHTKSFSCLKIDWILVTRLILAIIYPKNG